eukprot:6183794-Pleurochrysis_carterae.AAC.2
MAHVLCLDRTKLEFITQGCECAAAGGRAVCTKDGPGGEREGDVLRCGHPTKHDAINLRMFRCLDELRVGTNGRRAIGRSMG